jgi:hypothetical protein
MVHTQLATYHCNRLFFLSFFRGERSHQLAGPSRGIKVRVISKKERISYYKINNLHKSYTDDVISALVEPARSLGG